MSLDPVQRRAAARALARKLRRELAERQAAGQQAKAQRKASNHLLNKKEDYERAKEYAHRMGKEFALKSGAIKHHVWWGHSNPDAAKEYGRAYRLANREKRRAQAREWYQRKKAEKAKAP